jgi:hypothetical protein
MNKQVDKWVEDEIKKIKQTIHPYNGKIYQAENLITGEMRILRRSLDDIVRHNEDYQVKIYAVSDFSEKLKEWKAIGWKPVDAGKHEEAEYFLYYELEVMGKIVSKERYYIPFRRPDL